MPCHIEGQRTHPQVFSTCVGHAVSKSGGKVQAGSLPAEPAC